MNITEAYRTQIVKKDVKEIESQSGAAEKNGTPMCLAVTTFGIALGGIALLVIGIVVKNKPMAWTGGATLGAAVATGICGIFSLCWGKRVAKDAAQGTQNVTNAPAPGPREVTV
jgi:hypothetical protein